MKRKPIVFAFVCALVLALAGSTVAAYTVTGKATNAVSASNVKIQLLLLEDTGQGAPSTITGNVAIMPGETQSCIASVKNTGAETAWVRVHVSAEVAGDTVSLVDSPYITLEDLNSTEWVFKDDYWYYTKPLDPNTTTQELFTAVSFNNSIDNELSKASLTLNVEAQATQTEHNGSTVLEAQGW